MIQTITRQEVKDVLLNPKGVGIKEPYYLIEGDNQNITVVASGKNDYEFNKTFGYFHTYLGALIYTCLSGQGILIMQRNDFEGEPKEFKVVTLHSGKQVEIPAGYAHCLVNIGKGFLVTLDNGPKNPKFRDTERLKVKRGLAYYVVEKKGDIAFEANPAYRVHPQITSE